MKRSILVLTAVAVLVIAGGAFAAAQITGSQIKNSTITGKDVKNKSLTPKDFKGSVRGPRGFTGAQGLAGPAGPTGPQGPAGPVNTGAIVRVEQTATVFGGDVDSVTAFCPAGHGLISGGFVGIAADGEVFYADDFASRNSWSVGMDNFDSSVAGQVTAIAYCAPSGKAVTARAMTKSAVRSKANARDAAMIAAHRQ